jgi:putative flippase GtrA
MTSAAPAKLPAEFLRFLVAGAAGFGVDSVLLLAFTQLLGWPALLARLASLAIAITSTWLINRLWTFRNSPRSRSIGAEFLSYTAVQGTGAATNYAIYAVIVSLIGRASWQLLLALAAGSAAALAVNYFGARKFVFRRD